MKKGNEYVKMKEMFEAEVEVEFNDYVYDSLITLSQRFGVDIVKKALPRLKETKYKLNSYKDLMAFLAGICKNLQLEKSKIKNLS